MTSLNLDSARPWWRFGHVWLVISGPAVVVVASFFTLYLAITRGDPVVDESYFQPPSASTAAAQAGGTGSQAPAMLGRNHAATGVQSAAAAR